MLPRADKETLSLPEPSGRDTTTISGLGSKVPPSRMMTRARSTCTFQALPAREPSGLTSVDDDPRAPGELLIVTQLARQDMQMGEAEATHQKQQGIQ